MPNSKKKTQSRTTKSRAVVGNIRAASGTSRSFIAFVAAILVITLGFVWFNNTRQSPSKLIDETAYIDITSAGFSPATIKIKKGTSIVWVNKDTKPHEIADSRLDGDSDLDSNTPLGQNESFQTAIQSAGTYNYNDHLNPDTFKGVIIVE